MALAASELTYGFEALWPERGPRIYFDPASVNAAQILSELPVELVDSAPEADLLWIRKNAGEWYDQLGPFQAINHIPLERSMIRKADLAQNLHRHGASRSQAAFSHADFFQPTYCLNDPEERTAFFRQLPEADHRDNLWILKPSNLSRGRGVKIVWDFAALRKELRKHGEITLSYEGRTLEYVIQRYIKNVLLLDGKKSEIRIYWLIACLDPLLVLMYPEGTARLTLQPYKLGDFGNPLIHITNAYQQKKHGGDDPDAVLKWDFGRLQEYLANEKGAPANFLEEVLRPRLRQSLAHVVRASIDSLKQTPSPGFFFGLYGADFILDDRLTPWLTEIQKGPGLSHDDVVKQRVMPAMLRGAASIVLEILALKRKGQPLTALSSTQGYEWVIRDPAT
jgi:tubulin-tyrosine ligase family protein